MEESQSKEKEFLTIINAILSRNEDVEIRSSKDCVKIYAIKKKKIAEISTKE